MLLAWTPSYAAPLKVVVSIQPLALLVSELGGDQVSVTTLLKPGASPHGFEVSPIQVRKLAGADLFVSVGAELDPWAERMARSVRKQQANLVLASAVPLLPFGNEADHDHGHDSDAVEGDPHYWLDPLLVRDYVLPALLSALSNLAPDKALAFDARFKRMVAGMTDLHQQLVADLAPVSGKAFIAFHGTWAYFADRYGLKQVAVVEPLPGREPSARWMMKVIKAARDANAQAMIIEPQFNPRIAYTIAKQFGGRVVEADPLGIPGRQDDESYGAMMRANGAAFKAGLAP
jgi:ABC-type Zn uptake system ZnuABC Zn-binding protein ZnuA